MRKIWHKIRGVFGVAVDAVIPPVCVGCDDVIAGRDMMGALYGSGGGDSGGGNSSISVKQRSLCPTCWDAIRFCGDDICVTCGVDMVEGVAGLRCMTCVNTKPHYDTARGAWFYNQMAVDITLKFKHTDATHYAPMLADYMAVQAGAMIHDLQGQIYDAIIPVPLHRSRLFKRQYNQSALLARHLSKILNIPTIPNSLRRIKKTESQGKYNAKDRAKNVKGAFTYQPDILSKITRSEFNPQGKTILIIDDVMTSGATVNECARVLKKHGAERVDVLALCRAVRHKI